MVEEADQLCCATKSHISTGDSNMAGIPCSNALITCCSNTLRPEYDIEKCTFDEVRDILERSSLLTVTIDCQRLVSQGLCHKVADNSAIIEGHAWSIGVEDSDNSYLHACILHEMQSA